MLILATQSETRRRLLMEAGVEFKAVKSPLDETALQIELQNLSAPEMAQALAVAKAQALSVIHPHDYIVGVDQTCELDGRIVHKPRNMQDAKTQLKAFRGKTHSLHTAFAVMKNDVTVSRHCETSSITMRHFSDATLENYLLTTAENAMSSVGCYQLEGRGIQLMERIEGDYFTILGLPLLPLLKQLRDLGLEPS